MDFVNFERAFELLPYLYLFGLFGLNCIKFGAEGIYAPYACNAKHYDYYISKTGYAMAQLVRTLFYKPEGH
jgi:hypothetical protein